MFHKNKIAVVDYNNYASGDETKRLNFIQEFGDSFSNMGFAIVRNHGVTKELKDKLFAVSKAFFELSTDEKRSEINHRLVPEQSPPTSNLSKVAKGC